MAKKGITPVVGVVLLIGITIAAVGTVYTIFNDTVASTDTDVPEKVSKTNIQPSTAYESDGDIIMAVRNSGEVPVNVSSFRLMIRPEGEGSAMSYTAYSRLYPDKVDQEVNYRFEQGDDRFFIDPYNGTQTGKEWYPDANQLGSGSPIEQGVSSFAITVYHETDAGKDYLVLNNQNSDTKNSSSTVSYGYARVDLFDIPTGSTEEYIDGKNGEGPGPPSSRDELDLSKEPEGLWGWILGDDCCYDGGVVELPGGWKTIGVEMQDTNMKNLNLYEKGNGSIEIEKYEPITLRKIQGNKCFDADVETVTLERGDFYTCNTGLKMPDVEEVILVADLKGTQKSWEYRCNPRNSEEEDSC